MNILRSTLFNILFYGGSLFFSTILLPALALPQRGCLFVIRHVYIRYVWFINRYVMGLKLELRGMENIPEGSQYIIASKHQSALETVIMPYMKELNFPAIILKKELTYIPLWGWYPLRLGFVAIDRGSGSRAMRSIIRGSQRSLKNGRPVIIYPQGTRTRPGAQESYKPGVAKLYKDMQVPVLPVALNTGLFWPKGAFIKKPGKVIFEFLPVIPPNMPTSEFMEKLETSIETASDALANEG